MNSFTRHFCRVNLNLTKNGPLYYFSPIAPAEGGPVLGPLFALAIGEVLQGEIVHAVVGWQERELALVDEVVRPVVRICVAGYLQGRKGVHCKMLMLKLS